MGVPSPYWCSHDPFFRKRGVGVWVDLVCLEVASFRKLGVGVSSQSPCFSLVLSGNSVWVCRTKILSGNAVCRTGSTARSANPVLMQPGLPVGPLILVVGCISNAIHSSAYFEPYLFVRAFRFVGESQKAPTSIPRYDRITLDFGAK